MQFLEDFIDALAETFTHPFKNDYDWAKMLCIFALVMIATVFAADNVAILRKGMNP